MKGLSTHAHRRILGAVILMLLVWPAGHRLVSHFAETNPWRLCGFAMYCTSHNIKVLVAGGRDGEYHDLSQTPMSKESRLALLIFEQRRKALGRFANPQGLAEVLFGEFPDVESITIAIKLERLNGRTSLLNTTTRVYSYERVEPPGN